MDDRQYMDPDDARYREHMQHLNKKFQRLHEHLLAIEDLIKRKADHMSVDLSKLQAAVASLEEKEAGAEALLDQLSTDIKGLQEAAANSNDPAVQSAVDAVTSTLTNLDNSLGKKVSEDTPAAPPEPPAPAAETPPEPAPGDGPISA